MRKKDTAKRAKLIKLIEEGVSIAPIERGGFLWCAASQDEWAKELDVAVRTFGRMIKEPPIVREVANVETPDGKTVKYALLRVAKSGEAPTKTPEHLANIMRKIWAQKSEAKLSPAQHGCLIGLAKALPEGHQLEIFKTILSDWPRFMARVKSMQGLAEEEGQTVVKRYYKYPCIAAMLNHPEAAIEVHCEALQAAGKPLPPALYKLFMAPG